MNPIPEKLISYRAYKDGVAFLGTADVQLPSIEYLTETLKGAGILGEVESPSLAQVASLVTTINFRAVTKEQAELMAPKAHALEFRGAQQVYDAGNGRYITQPVKVVMRAVPKKFDPGKFEVGAASDGSNEFEVNYLKIIIDNRTILEIDKFNYVFVINGIDYAREIRKALGM